MFHIVWSTAQKWSFLLRIFNTVLNSRKSHFAISDIFASSYQSIITSFPILEYFYANWFKHCFKHCYVATIVAVLKCQAKSLKANETRKRGLEHFTCNVNLPEVVKLRHNKLFRIKIRAKNRFSPHLINDPPSILRLYFQSSPMSFYFDPSPHFKILRESLRPCN